uniref:Uncharacterized protein n=1 Tax=Panagrolaimus sp. JU765 TaxID=591449 RepID=A0AC34RI29_9BILA
MKMLVYLRDFKISEGEVERWETVSTARSFFSLSLVSATAWGFRRAFALGILAGLGFGLFRLFVWAWFWHVFRRFDGS